MEETLEQLERAAEAAGLAHERTRRWGSTTLSATGEVEGQHVRFETTLSRDGNQSELRLTTALAPTMDLGLRVRTRLVAIATGLEVDTEGFTAEHHVLGDDPARVRALLDADVCQAIVRLDALGGTLDIDDRAIAVHQGRGFAELRGTFVAMAQVARAMKTSYATLPAASALAEAAAGWERYALHHGLRFTASPLVLDGPQVVARTVRTGAGRFRCTLGARHDEPLEIGVTLRPAGKLARLVEVFRGADVQLGDPAFDRAFTVTERTPGAARDLLDDEVRRELLGLQAQGPVTLDDAGATLDTERVAEAPSALDRMAFTLDRLRARARARGKIGPYR